VSVGVELHSGTDRERKIGGAVAEWQTDYHWSGSGRRFEEQSPP